jgi:hypothetical protein
MPHFERIDQSDALTLEAQDHTIYDKTHSGHSVQWAETGSALDHHEYHAGIHTRTRAVLTGHNFTSTGHLTQTHAPLTTHNIVTKSPSINTRHVGLSGHSTQYKTLDEKITSDSHTEIVGSSQYTETNNTQLLHHVPHQLSEQAPVFNIGGQTHTTSASSISISAAVMQRKASSLMQSGKLSQVKATVAALGHKSKHIQIHP